jgi:hypothetical protein
MDNTGTAFLVKFVFALEVKRGRGVPSKSDLLVKGRIFIHIAHSQAFALAWRKELL